MKFKIGDRFKGPRDIGYWYQIINIENGIYYYSVNRLDGYTYKAFMPIKNLESLDLYMIIDGNDILKELINA